MLPMKENQVNPSEDNSQEISQYLTPKQIVALIAVILLLCTSIVLSLTLIDKQNNVTLSTTTTTTAATTTTIPPIITLEGKILIVTGKPNNNGRYSEVIHMDNENITCQGLTYAPSEIVEGTGGLVKGKALICGGYENGAGDSNKCWILGKSKIISMAYKRVAASSIVVQNKLWVTGGYGISQNPTSSETSEFIDEKGATSGPDLQWKFYSHCASMMNSTHGILTGGDDGYPRRTLMVNLNNFEMTRGPDLKEYGRLTHSCAHIRHTNGSNFIIAVGGQYYNDGYHYSDTTEILDADEASKPNGCWNPGPKLPQKCAYGSMVTLPNDNEAVLVGCEDENLDFTEKIYKLTWQGEHLNWVTMAQELKYPRYDAVAMLVQNEITNCN